MTNGIELVSLVNTRHCFFYGFPDEGAELFDC